MGRKFLDARPDYSDPLGGFQTLNAGEMASWGAPANEVKAFDAVREWTGPELIPKAGDLPVGTPGNDTLIKFLRWWGEPVVWRVIGKNLNKMPDNSVTLLADKIIAMLPFDAKEYGDDTNRNAYGNNDYALSNIRQWLNSEKGAGSWYSPQHEADRAPSSGSVESNAYTGWAGFLNSATENEKSVLLTTHRSFGNRYGNNTSCDDRVFLLTIVDQNPNNQNKIPYFVDQNANIAQVTAQCVAHNDSKAKPTTTDNWSYWTSTSYAALSCKVLYITSDGSAGGANQFAYNGQFGVRPACNISADTPLSLEPDEDGCYTVIA